MPANKPLRDVSQATGSGVRYFDGGRERYISNTQLKEIRSSVRTHEGEYLKGREARKYMDRHSAKMLKKDLSGSYNDTRLTGYV